MSAQSNIKNKYPTDQFYALNRESIEDFKKAIGFVDDYENESFQSPETDKDGVMTNITIQDNGCTETRCLFPDGLLHIRYSKDSEHIGSLFVTLEADPDTKDGKRLKLEMRNKITGEVKVEYKPYPKGIPTYVDGDYKSYEV